MYRTNDSGYRRTWGTGAQRDVVKDKPDFLKFLVLRAMMLEQERLTGIPFIVEAAGVPSLTPTFAQLYDDYRPDLLPEIALERLAMLLGRGAKKYGDRNWELGIPVDVFAASALRHMMQWLLGDTTEDHAAAVLFNIAAAMTTEARVQAGELPSSLIGYYGVLGKQVDYDSDDSSVKP
jgi:hypothetical protein